jgi:hypothetical protein
MFNQIFNWRSLLVLAAIAIASGSIFYSNYLAKKIAQDERKKVNVWIQSLKTRAVVTEQSALNLTNVITNENTDIPIIETDENDIPSGQGLNLDSNLLRTDPDYLNRMVEQFRSENKPFEVEVSKEPLIRNKYYYGDSKLLKEVRYYPLIQLLIIALFIIGLIMIINLRNRATQNLVWAGMAKETAHQLGTPLTSIQGWVEMLKESGSNDKIAGEMEKDVKRLKLVSDRFGKIGSTPQLEPANPVKQVEDMIAYISKRAPSKVNFHLDRHGKKDIPVLMNAPLFDWVIENLLKNALDALEGEGDISVSIKDGPDQVIIDVSDTGKGISKKHIPLVFKPGFSTKKRGWGLGLSLSKRIMEQYHRGELYVKQSEPGKGSTFRVILRKSPRLN